MRKYILFSSNILFIPNFACTQKICTKNCMQNIGITLQNWQNPRRILPCNPCGANFSIAKFWFIVLGLFGFLFIGTSDQLLAQQVPPYSHQQLNADPTKEKQKFATDRFIVKFKSEGDQAVNEDVEFLLENKGKFKNAVSDQSDSLDNLRIKHKLKKAKGLFVERHGLTTRDAKQKFNNAKQLSKVMHQTKSQRTPPNAPSPDLSNVYVIDVPQGSDIEDVVRDYQADPHVEYAQPDYIMEANIVPNDPFYSTASSYGQGYDDLWGLKKISAQQTWDITQGEGIVVAVVDSGVDYNHPDITANVLTNIGEIPNNGLDDDGNGFKDDVMGWNFVNNDNNPMDVNGHGTHVAGIIAAVGNNDKGIIGIAPKTKIMPIKGLNDTGYGSTSTLANGIIYAAQNGADVINNSWGCAMGCPSNPIVEDAVKTAYQLGVVVVVAAGNDNNDAANYSPANMPETIAVAASDYQDKKYSQSNSGALIDVTSPGVGVLSLNAQSGNNVIALTYPANIVGGDYLQLNGTSTAAPYVSGLAALLLSHDPMLAPDEIKRMIIAGVDPLSEDYSGTMGSGRINAYKTLTQQKRPYFKIINFSFEELLGNSNMIPEPGERIGVTVTIKNLWANAALVNATLSTTSAQISSVVKSSYDFAGMSQDQLSNSSSDPFILELGIISPSSIIPLTLTINADGSTQELTIPFDPSQIPVFNPPVTYPAGQQPSGLTINDFNKDDHNDFALTNKNDNTFSLFINKGDGTFADKINYATDSNPTSIDSEDFNKDGYADIVIANNQARAISIFINKGDGTFNDKIDYTTGDYPFSVAVGFFNNDLFPDIVTANSNGVNTISVLMNNGDGTFANHADYAAGRDPQKVAVADFDQDGNMDIAVSNFSGLNFSIFRNNGNGTFANRVNYDAGGNGSGITVGKFNSDDFPDIAITNTNQHTISVFLNNKGTFPTRSSYANVKKDTEIYYISNAMARADINSDGYDDLLAANTSETTKCKVCNNNSNIISIFRNKGDGSGTFFERIEYNVGGSSPAAIVSGLLNNDTYPDFMTANLNSNTVSVTTRKSPPGFHPPVLDHIGPQNVDEGQPLSFMISATDPDNDPLTYTASNLPISASLIGQTFYWTPIYSQSGTYPVVFSVSDGSLSQSETVAISVVDAPMTDMTLSDNADDFPISAFSKAIMPPQPNTLCPHFRDVIFNAGINSYDSGGKYYKPANASFASTNCDANADVIYDGGGKYIPPPDPTIQSRDYSIGNTTPDENAFMQLFLDKTINDPANLKALIQDTLNKAGKIGYTVNYDETQRYIVVEKLPEDVVNGSIAIREQRERVIFKYNGPLKGDRFISYKDGKFTFTFKKLGVNYNAKVTHPTVVHEAKTICATLPKFFCVGGGLTEWCTIVGFSEECITISLPKITSTESTAFTNALTNDRVYEGSFEKNPDGTETYKTTPMEPIDIQIEPIQWADPEPPDLLESLVSSMTNMTFGIMKNVINDFVQPVEEEMAQKIGNAVAVQIPSIQTYLRELLDALKSPLKNFYDRGADLAGRVDAYPLTATQRSLLLSLTGFDSDKDGIKDWWEIKNFDDYWNTYPEGDFDKDGLTNLYEYLNDMDPIKIPQRIIDTLTVPGAEAITYHADDIKTAGPVTVESGGELILTGDKITLTSGFSAEEGGRVVAGAPPDIEYSF